MEINTAQRLKPFLQSAISEREIRPSVVFRKVTSGVRSRWGAHIHAGYRSVTGTAKLHGRTALQAIGQLLTGTFEPTLTS